MRLASRPGGQSDGQRRGVIVEHPVAVPRSSIGRLWKVKLSQRAREEITAYCFLGPWIIGFVVFVAGCMGYSLGLSFFVSDMLTETRFIGISNYQRLFFVDPLFKQALKVTALYSVGAVPLRVILAMMIALLLNQKVRAQGLWRTLYYMPSVVSGVAVTILWTWMFNPDFGLINAALAALGIKGPLWIYSTTWALPALVVMSLWGVGGNMLLYLAGLQGIPTHLYEAARIDGANAVHCFWHITIPMLTPTIFFNLVMNFIGSFQVFTQSYMMTAGGPDNATLTMVLLLYRKGFEQFHFGYASAIAWVLFAIIMVLTLMVVRSSALWVYYEGELRK
jgi:multiple sugar transport system permease protein